MVQGSGVLRVYGLESDRGFTNSSSKRRDGLGFRV